MSDSTQREINITALDAAEKAGGVVPALSAADVAVRTPPAPRVVPGATDPATNPASFDDFRQSRNLTPEETAVISDNYQKRLKDQTDAISATFADKSARQKETNDAELSRTRVLNARTGNTDSGTGSAAVSTTTKKGNDALAAIDNEKEAKIEQAIGAIDDLKVKHIEAETAKKTNDLTAYNNLRATNAKTADTNLQSLAKAGANLEALKTDRKDPNNPNEPSTFDTLAKSLDLTPLELTTKFNAYKDAAHQIKYTFKVAGDKILAYGVDPVTGKLSEQEQTVPGLSSGNWELKEMKDGSIYKFNKDTSDLEPLFPKGPSDTKPLTDSSGETIAPGKPIVDGSLKTSQGEINKTIDLFTHGGTINGTDYPAAATTTGFANPGLYNLMYDNWIKGHGTAQGFVKYFPPKKYVDPKDNSKLPPILRHTGSSSSPNSGGGS